MQPQVIQIALSAPPIPVVKPQVARGWVEYGTQHSYWSEIIKLKKKSTTQRSVSKTRSEMVRGGGFAFDKDNKVLSDFMGKMAGGKHANTQLKGIAADIELTGAFALQVIWNAKGDSIIEIYHEPIRRVACGLMNKDEEIEEYYLCRDWSKANQPKFKPERIAAFNKTTAAEEKRQLYVHMVPSDANDYYSEPDCDGAINYLQLEADLAEFHLGNVQGNFSASNIMYMPGMPKPEGKQTQQEANDAFVAKLEKSFTGPKGKRLIVVWGAQGDPKAATVAPLSPAIEPDLFTTYSELCVEKILAANRVTSPVIVGLPGGASLGGDANTIRAAYELFYNVVIRPTQVDIIEAFIELLGHVKGVELKGDPEKPDLDIITTLPIKMTFSESLLQDISDVDELRAMVDMKPLEVQQIDEETRDKIIEMVEKVHTGDIPRDSALGILTVLYGVKKEDAESLLGKDPATAAAA